MQRNESVDSSSLPSLAPILGARRDGRASADSAGALVMSMLGEFVWPSGGGVWTQTLIAALEEFDVRDKATRQTLARSETRGWLTRQRIGRKTRWLLTDHSSDLLSSGAQRIYGFGMTPRQWDGRWLVLLASVPERDRAARYRMTQGLGWAGFGSLGQGVWISPRPEEEKLILDLLTGLEVSATSFIAELSMLGTAEDLTAQAWDLPAVRTLYNEFLDWCDEIDPEKYPAADPARQMVLLTELVHRWRRFPFLDPDLPDDLLDANWPTRRAAQRFAELRAGLLPGAQSWWQAQERTNAPAGWSHP